MPFTGGNEFGVNQELSSDQLTGLPETGSIGLVDSTVNNRPMQSTAMDAAGNMVVTWSSLGQDLPSQANFWGVYARRYDAVTKQWGPEFLVNPGPPNDASGARNENQAASAVAMDESGNFVITWTSGISYLSQPDDPGSYGIYAQRYSPAGVAVGSAFLINKTTVSDQTNASIAIDSDGGSGFVVAWESRNQDSAGTRGIYLRRYNTDGTPKDAADVRVNTYTTSDQIHPTVAMANDGSYIVVWESNNQPGDTNWGIYAKRYNADGTLKDAADVRINTFTANDQRNASVSMDASGNYVVTWTSDRKGTIGQEIYARRYNSAGVALGDEFSVSGDITGAQVRSQVKMVKTGGFIITWTGEDAGATGVFARRYDANGNPLSPTEGGTPFLINQSISGNQDYASLASDGAGNFAISWTSDQAGNDDVYNRIYSVTPSTNNAPTVLTLTPRTVFENVADNTTIGTFATTDPDGDLVFGYELVSGTGSTDNSAFNIFKNPISGAFELRINNSPDFEIKPSYSVRAKTTDPGGLSKEDVFTITVTNLNEQPTDITVTPNQVSENVVVGTTVGKLTTTDPDVGNTFVYELVTGPGGTDNAFFKISGDQLQTNAAINFEAKSSYSILVKTTDQNGLSTQKVFTINAVNVNEAPTGLTLAPSNINENVPANSVVGTLTGTDPDAGDVLTYELAPTGTDNGAFTIVGNQLRIKSSPDFETKSSYAINIRVKDAAGLFIDRPFTVTINNLVDPPTNLAPTDVLLTPAVVNENVAANAVVGALSSTDPNGAGETFTYSLVTGIGDTDNSAFTIVGSSLRINASPDFELKSSYSVRIRTTDQGGLSTEKAITITVADLNEQPTGILLAPDSIAEGVNPGTQVGVLSTTDPDNADAVKDDTFVYALVTGTGSTDNAAFTLTADGKLAINVRPDFETKTAYAIRVRVTDRNGTGLTFEKELIVNVTDVAEPGSPTDLTITKSDIDENLPINSVVGTLGTVDADSPGGPFTYTIDSSFGDAADFTINASNQLVLKPAANFEAKPNYRVRVKTTDPTGLPFSKELQIRVNDVNEKPTELTLSATVIDENKPADSIVGTFLTTDPDLGDSFTYSLVTGGTDNAAFRINGNELRLIGIPNFEAKPAYAILVRVTDSKGLFFDKALTITVRDVGEQPTAVTLAPSAIDENKPINSVVGTLSTVDPDPNERFTYTLVTGTGSSDNAAFAIVGNQLQIRNVPNFETKPSYAVRVRSTDKDGLFREEALIIRVNDLNETPLSFSLSATNINENVPDNSLVGAFNTIDSDTNDTFTYTLVGTGNDNAAFAIVNNELRIKNSPDFENKASYTIRVRTTDSKGLFIEQPFTIQINNVNEAPGTNVPTDLQLSATTIDENKPANSLIGTLSTVDRDQGETFTYSLVGTGNDNAAFTIVNNELRIRAIPDFEVKPSYSIRLRTTDRGGLFFEKSFTITVRDLPETPGTTTPQDLALSSSTIDENRPANSLIGTFTTTDPDRGDSFRYSLVTGQGSTDNAAFTIVNNELRIIGIPNFEAKPTYSIRVRTTDVGNLFFEKVFTINVRDLPETPGTTAPQDLILSSNQVDENKPPNTVVGTLSTVDPDLGDRFTYSLVTGQGSADNAAFTVVNNELRLNVYPDFETKPTYSVRLRTTDLGGLFFEKVFTISVKNLPETPGTTVPRDILLSNSTVDENKPIDTVIGTFSSVDPDVGDRFTYSLVAGQGSTDNGSFKIVNNELRLNFVPDFEKKVTYNIRVRTTDVGGLAFEKIFTVIVNDLPELPGTTRPQDLLLSNSQIDENRLANSVVGTLSTVDPDNGETFTYSLVAGQGSTDNAAFTIVNNQLKLKGVPNFEAKSSYSIRIRTTDFGGLTFEKAFTISVKDLPETPGTTIPQDILLSNNRIDENRPINSPIGTFSTIDPDVGDRFTYSLVAGDGSGDNTLFTIVGNELRILASPNFEAKPTYTIRVRTTDVGNLSFDKIFTINVNDLPERPGDNNPSDLLLSKTTIDENVPAGTAVGTITTVDPDQGDQFTYTLVPGFGDNAAFSIAENQLRVNSSPNFEVKPAYQVQIKTTDLGGRSFTKTLTIGVNNLNDPPLVTTSAGSLTYREGSPEQVIDGALTISDIDSVNLEGGTVRIVGFAAGQDQLRLPPQNGITGSFDAATGVLTLTGTASLAAYQTALRSITYLNRSTNPSTAVRTVQFSVRDGFSTSNLAPRTIQVIPVDTAPLLTASSGSLAYVENSGDLAVDAGIAVLDEDSLNLTGATIRIVGYVAGEDRLNLTPQAGITSNFNTAQGILTLTGNASVASYQAALRSVSYFNSSGNPNQALRTVQFSVRDNSATSNIVSRTIQVSRIESPSIVTTSGGSLAYVENTGRVAVDSQLTVVDADSQSLTGATVRIQGVLPSQDRLSVTLQDGITGGYDAASGVLTLTGAATLASYQTVLRSVGYTNSSENPSVAARVVQFTVQNNGVVSNLASRSIQVIPVNDPPVIKPAVKTITFARDPILLDSKLMLSDIDSPILTSATVTIGNFIAGEDELRFADRADITGNFNPNTGVLQLTGSAPLADYQAALRSVRYANSQPVPTGTPRTIELQASDGVTTSARGAAKIQVEFAPPGVVPSIDLNGTATGGDYSNTFVIGGAAIPVTASDARFNQNYPVFTSAQVAIANLLDGRSEVLTANTAGTNITATYDAIRGILNLTGSADPGSYLQVLRSVKYQNSDPSIDITTRTLLFTLSNGKSTSEPAQTRVQISQIRISNGTVGTDGSLFTTPATDLIDASTSDDSVVSTLENLKQTDNIQGGGGRDRFTLLDGSEPLGIDLDNSVNQVSGLAGTDTTITGFEVYQLTGFIGTATMLGSELQDDTLVGGLGNDSILGRAGNDVLGGSAGNDQIDGGAGNDQMEGGIGDDLYIVDSQDDLILEGANQGLDTVQSTINTTLGNNVEALLLIGATAGSGNSLNNQLTGNRLKNKLNGEAGDDLLVGDSGQDELLGGSGNDRIVGGSGRDKVSGSRGRDRFVLSTARKNSLDTLRDFSSKDDTIEVIRGGFSRSLKRGKIRANQLQIGARAEDRSDRFIYNRSSGMLYFDADGSGSSAQVQIARLSNRASLTRLDIVVVDF